MPIVTTHSVKLAGSEAVPVLVECSVEPGIGIHLVGLADANVKESLLRVVTALQANGFLIPGKKIIINLAPSDLRKEGSGYDLAVALALVAASEQDGGCLSDLRDWLVIGELGLDGSVREVPGTVQAVQAAIGLAVAIAAGVSIYWRKAKKKINKAIGREETASKDESDNINVG